ncbi:hypothetical protein AKJ16_DCAP21693 [Drosera capensis]
MADCSESLTAGCPNCVRNCIAVIWCSYCQRYLPGDRRAAFICCPGCGKVIADVIPKNKKPISKKTKKRASPSSVSSDVQPHQAVEVFKNSEKNKKRASSSSDHSNLQQKKMPPSSPIDSSKEQPKQIVNDARLHARVQPLD